MFAFINLVDKSLDINSSGNYKAINLYLQRITYCTCFFYSI